MGAGIAQVLLVAVRACRERLALSTHCTATARVVDLDIFCAQLAQEGYRAADWLCVFLRAQHIGTWSESTSSPQYLGSSTVLERLSAVAAKRVKVYGSRDVAPAGEFRVPDGVFGTTFGYDDVLHEPWHATDHSFSAFLAADLGKDSASCAAPETHYVVVLPRLWSWVQRRCREDHA